jgi:NAD(P)-dependent dehydrogenase (short-subunit alcohol dehydrogenase family)
VISEQQIIVTGASRGIGAAIAVELHRRGYAIVGLSRSGETPAGHGIACDVCDEDAVALAIEQTASRGPIVGLVNAAGIHENEPAATLTIADFERMMRINTSSVLLMSQRAYPHLKREDHSLIVNIGSFFDKMAVPDNTAYCASKAAVGAISRCLAAEWAGDGIRVLNVAPGYIETDLNRGYLSQDKVKAWLSRRIPVRHPGNTKDVARFVGALFSERIDFLTGETIYLDGAQGINH